MTSSEGTLEDGASGGSGDITVALNSGQVVIRQIPNRSPVQGSSDLIVDIDRADYVMTKDLKDADYWLQERGLVILCGPPGSGKTTLAHALARRSRKEGFTVYELDSMERFRSHVGEQKRSVVVLDGTFGKLYVNSEQHGYWNNILKTVITLTKEKKCRVVITVYPHVLCELNHLENDWHSPLKDFAVVNLTETLPKEVREKLLDFHLTKCRLDLDKRHKVMDDILQNDVSGPVFPWCCAYMSSHWNSSEDPTAVFLTPAEAYCPLLKDMVLDESHGHLHVAVFALTMKGVPFYDAKVHLEDLRLRHFFEDELSECAEARLDAIVSAGSFSSRVLYEAAGLTLGRYFRLPVLIKVCDRKFLVQYVHMTKVSKNVPFTLCVTVGSVAIHPKDTKQSARDCQALVLRIYAEIIQGNLQDICQHPSLQCPEFLQELNKYCTGDRKRIQKLLNSVDPVHQLPLLYWSAFHSSPRLTRWCLSEIGADKLSVRVLMACSLFDCLAQNPEYRIQSSLQEALVPQHLEHTQSDMAFPLLAKDQCLTREMKKQMEIVADTGSGRKKLVYLRNPALPLRADIVKLQISDDKLYMQLPNKQHWYLVFRLLTDRGVSETDRDGNSLLHIAACSGELAPVLLSLRAGAVTTQQNRQSVTPRQLISKNMDRILRHIPDSDKVEARRLLLQEISVDERDSEGRTGLLRACREGRGDIADLYIELGADVNMKDTVPYTESVQPGNGEVSHDCCTPLHYACLQGLVHTVDLLIQHDVDVASTTSNGHTALYFVSLCPSHSASDGITHQLVQAGSDVGTQNEQGNTPLHDDALRGHTDTAELLIRHHADVNAEKNDGFTPLHSAAYNGHTETAALLIRHGDVSAQTKDGFTPLHGAAYKGHTDTAELLIRHHADVNAQNKHGVTPLHNAVCNGHKDTAELLIQHHGDVSAQTKDGFTPLHGAAFKGHTDTAELLIRHHGGVSAQNKDGFTPLHNAAYKGHTDTAELLIRHHGDVSAQNKDGFTPLHNAACNGHTDTAELLIRHHGDVSAQTKNGVTPLHNAACNGHKDTAELLIRHHADVSAQDTNGITPLHTAACNGRTDTAELLIRHHADVSAQTKNGFTPLHDAACNGHKDTAELLIRHNADVSAQTKDGTTPLHSAAYKGHTDTAELLIRHNADVSAQSKNGITPIYSAAFKGHTDTVELLIRHHGDANAQTKNGTTPLHVAAQNGHTHTAELLIRHHGDVSAQTKNGTTPLHVAAQNGHTHIAELLIRHHGDVSAQTKDGVTPLLFAALNGHTHIAELLIRHHADVSAQTKDGFTPLHCAANSGHTDTAELLIRHHADVSAQTKVGFTPLHCAANSGHTDTAELLIRHHADVSAQTKVGFTPLHAAAQNGHTDTAELLIRHHGDVSA